MEFIDIRYCVKCKWSVTGYEHAILDRCFHPKVSLNCPEALASKKTTDYPYCRHERAKRFWRFPSCGMKGKLWEAR